MPYNFAGLAPTVLAAGGAMAAVYYDPIPTTLIPAFFPATLVPATEAVAGVLLTTVAMDFFPTLGQLSMVQKERYMLSTFLSTLAAGMFGNVFLPNVEFNRLLMIGSGAGVIGSYILPENFHLIK